MHHFFKFGQVYNLTYLETVLFEPKLNNFCVQDGRRGRSEIRTEEVDSLF